MRLATWNVNSLKVRLPQLIDWLARCQPDVVCLQETKLEDAAFPLGEIHAAGYHAVFAGQKTYNGVAVLAKTPPTDVTTDNPFFPDAQRRLLATTIDGIRVVCAYVPNGQALDSDKYQYKLAWLAALERWVADQLTATPNLVLAGDFNIAPEDRDVHDPAAWAGQILCSQTERTAFQNLLGLGLQDAFRLFEQPEHTFSWWDYRRLGFQRNRGLRIDHILLSLSLAERCTATWIERDLRKLERPSDHAPVVTEIAT